jgi:hypothetical protein
MLTERVQLCTERAALARAAAGEQHVWSQTSAPTEVSTGGYFRAESRLIIVS